MPKNVSVPAVLYEVSRDFTVRRGQYVMIVGDQCIGVHSGIDTAPMSKTVSVGETIREPASQPQSKAKSRKKGYTKGHVYYRASFDKPLTDVTKMEAVNSIVGVLKVQGTLTPKEFRAMLGIQETQLPWTYRFAVQYCTHHGWISNAGGKNGKYEITQKGMTFTPYQTAASSTPSMDAA